MTRAQLVAMRDRLRTGRPVPYRELVALADYALEQQEMIQRLHQENARLSAPPLL